MTSQQNAAIKADILATPILNAFPNNTDGAFAIAALYNQLAAPAYIVWRTDVTREQIYNDTSAEATNWSWVFYKSQNVTEQNAWVQMFMGDVANFSKANLRTGITNIFTAASAANATHALAIGKRKATRIEKLLAVGSGTTPSPSVMGFEGEITFEEVDAARNS